MEKQEQFRKKAFKSDRFLWESFVVVVISKVLTSRVFYNFIIENTFSVEFYVELNGPCRHIKDIVIESLLLKSVGFLSFCLLIDWLTFS